MRIVSMGQVVFALTMIGVGVLGWMRGDFVRSGSQCPRRFPRAKC